MTARGVVDVRRAILAGALLLLATTWVALAQDECATAIEMEPGVPVLIDTAKATGSPESVDATPCPGTFLDWGAPAANPDVWLVWTPTESGLASFSTCDPSGFDTSIVLYEGPCDGLSTVACNGDGVIDSTCQAYYSRIESHVVDAGSTYRLRVGGWQGTVGSTSVLLEFVPFSETCGPAAGSCAAASTSPGCADASCCASVCNVDPVCCDVAWDQSCVDVAVSLCDLYVPDCPDAPTAPPNDCPTTPIVVEDGDAIAFDTTQAATVGPAADCGSGKDDQQIHRDLWYRFESPADGVLVASTCGSATFDTKIGLYRLEVDPEAFDPSDLPSLPFVCSDDAEGCGEFSSRLQVVLDAGDAVLIRLGGFFFQSGTGTISFDFVPDAIACGDPAAETCCDAGLGPHCADGSCCETVCAVDPACCEESWDALCADLAFQHCAPLCGEPLPPQVCDRPGEAPVSAVDPFEGTAGIGCQVAGVTTANTYGVVFTRAQLGSVYAFDCIDFGYGNSGVYLEGEIAVWIDENGGAPSSGDLELLESRPVGLYTGDARQATVVGERQCIELVGMQTLVVTLAIPQATGGFASFAGGTAGSTTYLKSEACGLDDFVSLESLGHVGTSWWVRLSGDEGCHEPLPADLNGDGLVNGWDLGLIVVRWGACSECPEDLDGSGVVDSADLAILLDDWQPGVP